MNDLISRQAAIDEHRLKNAIYKFVDKYGQIKMSITQFNILLEQNRVEMINDAPTIEPERKKGKWIVRDNPGTGWYRVTCSECGEDVTSVIPMIGFFPNAKPLWDFCPNCGADMRGEQNG